MAFSAFHDLASTYLYCIEKEKQLNKSLPARSPLKVKIVKHVFAEDLYPTLTEEEFAKVDDALTRIFIAKAGDIENYATQQEGRHLYCELIVKNVVITCTSEGDGVLFIRHVNTIGRSVSTNLIINLAKQPY